MSMSILAVVNHPLKGIVSEIDPDSGSTNWLL